MNDEDKRKSFMELTDQFGEFFRRAVEDSKINWTVREFIVAYMASLYLPLAASEMTEKQFLLICKTVFDGSREFIPIVTKDATR